MMAIRSFNIILRCCMKEKITFVGWAELNNTSDRLHCLFMMPFCLSDRNDILFVPLHFSRKHLLGTNLRDKWKNTCNLMFGVEPGGDNYFGFHPSRTIYYNSVTSYSDWVIKPGLIDVITLGIFYLIPILLLHLSIGLLLSIHSERKEKKPINQPINFFLQSLKWLMSIFLAVFTVPAVIVSFVSVLMRNLLGYLLLTAVAPIVATVHLFSLIYNSLTTNKQSDTTQRAEDTALLKKTFQHLDATLMSGNCANRIDLDLKLTVENEKFFIRPHYNSQYRSYFYSEVIDRSEEAHQIGEVIQDKNEKAVKDFASATDNVIPVTNIIKMNPSAFFASFSNYRQRGLVQVDKEAELAIKKIQTC